MSVADRAYRFCPRCGSALVASAVDEITRQACEAGCGFVHWDNPVPVVAGLVEHEGRIVLANNAGWPDDIFGLITGFLEKEESPEQAVLREVREELGLDGRVASLIGLYPFARFNQIILAFHVVASGDIRLGAELRRVKHVEPARLRAWDFGTGPAVRDWLAANVPQPDALR